MINRAISNAVFDLGGVLVDWNPEYLYRELIPDDQERQYFLTKVCSKEWHSNHDYGVSFAENAKRLLKEYPDDARMQALILAWGNRFNDMLGGPIKGTVEILEDLKKQGIRLFAMSNWAWESFVPIRAMYPFLSLFDDIIISGFERVAKPDAGIYDILLIPTHIDPKKSIYVDDAEKNLVPAKALGFTTIQFTNPETLRGELIRYQALPSVTKGDLNGRSRYCRTQS